MIRKSGSRFPEKIMHHQKCYCQEWEINMATPASAAAANVPMSTACMNGIDLRNARRIDCSRPASC
jgi:hypothetical protein